MRGKDGNTTRLRKRKKTYDLEYIALAGVAAKLSAESHECGSIRIFRNNETSQISTSEGKLRNACKMLFARLDLDMKADGPNDLALELATTPALVDFTTHIDRLLTIDGELVSIVLLEIA